jgi:hypothetical protein
LNKNNKNKRNTVIQKSKFKSTLLSNINDSSKKIVFDISNQIIDDDFNINNKNNSSKAINDKMDNSNKIFDLNKSNIKMETIIKDNNNTKDNNNNTKTKNIKKNRLGVKRDDKKLLMPNEIEKKRKSSFINNTIINNKSYASSLNYFNEIDKDNASRSENHLKQLNKKDPMKNSLTKELSIDENLQKKCDIF